MSYTKGKGLLRTETDRTKMLDSPGVVGSCSKTKDPFHSNNKVATRVMISKCNKGLVDGDDVYDKGRGGGFEGVMMMMVMKGEREWEGGRGHDDCSCVMSLEG
ncbi:hypothetical protein CR513_36138, partial [Mucuna pruriens]